MAVAVQKGLELHQVDIATAFLNGRLEEEVFMKQPEGFVEKGKEHLVCRLKAESVWPETVPTLLELYPGHSLEKHGIHAVGQ